MARAVREYDVVVVGSGSGATIVDSALCRGLKVALVERGPLGGTCPNTGCIPSRLLVFPADRVVEIRKRRNRAQRRRSSPLTSGR
jgi:mycothione reductase